MKGEKSKTSKWKYEKTFKKMFKGNSTRHTYSCRNPHVHILRIPLKTKTTTTKENPNKQIEAMISTKEL